jgi:hypothetical protein
MPISGGGYNPTPLIGALYGSCSNGQSFNSGFVVLPSGQYVTEMNTNLFRDYGDGASFLLLTSGLYAIDLSIYRSDFPANQHFTIGYALNNDQNKLYTEEMIQGQYGWNASSGPNNTRFGFHLAHMVRANANDYLNFNVNSDDGPRVDYWSFRVIRISN